MRRLVSTSSILIQSLVLAALLVLPQAGSASDRNISSERNSQSTSNVISIEAAESRKASAEELTAAIARAGTLQVTALGGGDALYEPGLDCPSDTIFGQPVHGPNDGWIALTSDAVVSPPYLVYENFSGLDSEICDVHWWGLNAFNDGYEWSPCEKTVDTFEIKFYEDAAGSPGAEVCTYTVTPSKADTGLYYLDVFPLYEYHIDLEECCYLPSGWVSIQGTGDPNCWFMWMSSGTGDSFCYQWDGDELIAKENDLSLCLTGGICPPGAAQENELCGQDTNGGCNMTNPHFEPISCGNTVCGTVWAQADPLGGGGERDTDWYTIDVPEMGGGSAELTFTVESLFPSAVFILEEGCNPIEILADGYGDLEQPAVVSAVVSTPGTYRLFVAPGTESGPIFSGIPCGSEQNNYAASVECIPSCTVECPPGAVDESETCGDDTNGGCNMDEPNFEPISCGDTVCGTAWYDGSTRDTDWYEIVTEEPIVLTWDVTAEFDVVAGLVETTVPGSGDCCDTTGYLSPYDVAGACETATITTSCLPPGTYWLFVAPDFYAQPFDCSGGNNDYVASVECTPCSPDIRIEPNQLNFDCYGGYGGENASDDTSGMQTSTKAYIKHNHSGSGERAGLAGNSVSMEQQERSPAEKLISAKEIMDAFEIGRDDVDVIVNLVRPAEVFATTSFRDAGSRRALQREVAGRQDAVLSALKSGEFGLKYRYENLAAFSGAVTRKALEKLMNNPAVASIEPVRILHAHLAQGVPLMNALDYRSTYNGQGMAIAICDTGIDYNHPMLGNGGFPNGKVIGGYDFGDDDGDPFPCNAHGTACAGLAAGDLGSVGDYIGGVAHNARLYALKISYGCTGSATTDAIVAAWDWCVSHQYDDPCNPIMAISTSFGGGRFFSAGSCDADTPAMTTAAENAVYAGITVLASAGNDGWCESMGWPACISSVISVGAVYDAAIGSIGFCIDPNSCTGEYYEACDSNWACFQTAAADMVACYSNTADFLDQLAPSNQAYTLNIGGYTSSFGGTSASSPYTAGAVACLQQAAKALSGSYLTPQQVRSTLAATGDVLADGKIPTIIKPRVNLGNAIDSLLPCPGQTMTIYNDGGGTLEVTSIDRPAWVSLLPLPPYSIPAGGSREVCVVVDCDSPAANAGYDLARLLTIHSNDPDENPYPDGVYLRVDCPSCGPAGDLDNDCDEDILDYSIFALHWQETGCDIADWCVGADLTQNGRVDMYDLGAFIEEWLCGTGL
jgi:subtilisin family serine protease